MNPKLPKLPLRQRCRKSRLVQVAVTGLGEIRKPPTPLLSLLLLPLYTCFYHGFDASLAMVMAQPFTAVINL